MKKFSYLAAAVLATGLFSCTSSTPKAELNSQIDSLSYAIGVSQTQGLKDYLVQRMNMDTLYMDNFTSGIIDGTKADAKQNAYYAGIQIGQQINEQILPGIAHEAFGDKGTQLNKTNFMEGFIAGVTAKDQKMTTQDAQKTTMTYMQSFKNDSTANAVADLTAKIDTFSYAIGLAQTQGLKQFLVYRMNMDTLYMDKFVNGVKKGADGLSDAKERAYYTGIQIGQQASTQIIPGINQQILATSGLELDENNFFAGFIAGINNKNLVMTPAEAQTYAMTTIENMQKVVMEQTYGSNKEEGIAFLDSIAKTEGVQKTESGLLYKVITKGTGKVPTKADKVKVHYRGTLIDGTEFDSSYKRNEPAVFPVTGVIPGWTEALLMMPAGSKWMLYIPQELAYADRDLGDIKPFSTLIFEVELLSIEK